MTRKHVERNAGNSGRINVSGSELDTLGLEIGDAVDVEVSDPTAVTRARIASTVSDELLIVTPA
ncbi:hypothetical protein [Halorubrum sp. DTA98]|uniref:hypothetical protein n=1 Tax=Halorubrum sp. DTA98 TaxID=3402163 RepID=UPI003AABE87D